MNFRSNEQKNFSQIISAHLQSLDCPLLLEGGTGLGKTRAYLFALIKAAKEGKRIAIVLPTHQLIDQLLKSSDILETRESVVIKDFRPHSMFETKAEYDTNKKLAIESQVMICTMASVIIDQRLDGEYNGVTKRDYILFDEADQLPDMSALQSNFMIEEQEIHQLNIPITTAEETLQKILNKPPRLVEPETKAAAKIILEAIQNPTWYQKGGFDDAQNLVLTHHVPGRLLKKLSNQHNVAFISATLSIGGTFNDFKSAMGIEKESNLSSIIEPEKHGYLTFHTDPHNIENQYKEWLQKTIKTIQESTKPCLVITTSHSDSELFGSSVLGATIRVKEETTTEAVARMSDQVLVAAGAWAGLDTPTQWASIVIPNIPFGKPTVIEGQVTTSYFNSRNTAIRRMRQAIGRGIRSPEAKCEVFILDDRIERIPSFIPKRFLTDWQNSFQEGGRVEVTLSMAERDASIRKKALEHYGAKCMGCEFLPRTSNQLDVHHKDPIAEGARKTKITDLAVLCANCHRLAHSRKPPLSIEEIRLNSI